MISVIACTKHPMPQSIHERNVGKTVGASCEYIPIDASGGGFGLALGYNYGVSLAQGDIIVFMHDDAFFMKPNWGNVLEARFAADPSLGIIGVAGTQHLFADKFSWTAACRPYIKGRIVHKLENGDFFAVVYSPENGDFEVVACDGVFFAVRASLFQTIRFDEQSFDNLFFHDLDLCMQARQLSRIMVTTDIVVKHHSSGTFDTTWQHYGSVFLQKWNAELPASCAPQEPGPEKRTGSQCVNLQGKAPPETIC